MAAEDVLDEALDKRRTEERYNEIKRLRRLTASQVETIVDLERKFNLIRDIRSASPTVPKWRAERVVSSKSKSKRAIPTLLLSDLHLDETVNPAEVEFYNAYDRDIAEARLEHVFRQAIDLSSQYVAGVSFDGICLALGGDLLSGDIHTELLRTNESTVFDSIVHWVPLLAAGIDMLADSFGKVYVPCVVGNHDRNPANKRVPSKMRAKDSVSWVICQWLADRFRADPRITFDVAEGADQMFSLYNTKYLLTHGDQFRGGNGIAGIWSPIMAGIKKKKERQSIIGKPFDVAIMGHLHQLTMGHGFIVNGSLKGYDEYAFTSNFRPEPPQQAFWLTTPEHGITVSMPIFAETKNEPWRAVA